MLHWVTGLIRYIKMVFALFGEVRRSIWVILAWFCGTGTSQWCNYTKWKHSRADRLSGKANGNSVLFSFQNGLPTQYRSPHETILQGMFQHRVAILLSDKKMHIHRNIETSIQMCPVIIPSRYRLLVNNNVEVIGCIVFSRHHHSIYIVLHLRICNIVSILSMFLKIYK